MRKVSTKVVKMLNRSLNLLVATGFAASLVACTGQFQPGDPGGSDDDSTVTPPGAADAGLPPNGNPPPPPPGTPRYVRGSLPPAFQLTPRQEYKRMAHKGIDMADTDFESNQVTTSLSLKMDEISAQINAEHPDAPPVDILKRPEDRQRADLIPFRGNPSDVKHFQDTATNTNKLYVPLGGDLMSPGNEVAVVNLQNNNQVTRVRVGLRPQKVAVNPSGLIFVCNQFSNYISVIDPRNDQLLQSGGKPAEVETEYYCSDITFAPRSLVAPDADENYMFVLNQYHHSVLMYSVDTVRDPISDRPNGFTSTLVKEITGVGMTPYKLTLSERKDALFTVSQNGGQVTRISIPNQAVVSTMNANGGVNDVVNIADQVIMPMETQDRGLLSRDELQKPQQTLSQPIIMTGVDGQPHQVNPGAIFDNTRSYNFEDVRDGILQSDFSLRGVNTYYTNAQSSEPNFVPQQKVLAGAGGAAIARNAAGTKIWITNASSLNVQELNVNTAVRPFSITPVPGGVFQTRERPFAVSVDEAAQRLYVADWGGEVLEIFNLQNRQLVASVDLGYAIPAYPATNIERGEFFFYDARWSNNGAKACANSCHLFNLIGDGIGYDNGVTTPTMYHQVKPNYNLLTTDSYFWNGSFNDGAYTSVAFAAQVRDNCELVAFSLIEGPSSNPATRVGDPNNVVTDGRDALCRPQAAGADRLPQNFAQIQQVIAAQKLVGKQHILDATGFEADDVIRFIDFYSVSELRIAPNPLAHLYSWGELDAGTKAAIDDGKDQFNNAACSSCHNPNNPRAPFTDGLMHGAGSDWPARFIARYQNDQRVFQQLPGGLPEKFLEVLTPSTNDRAINVQVDPLDYFTPFCFDVSNCLEFDDPLSVVGNLQEESRRLSLIIAINLGDADRQFMPGNVRGAPAMNTPSLRNVWQQAGLLHHAYAHSLREAILPPGHEALLPGELGFAVSNAGEFDNHGATSAMSKKQIDNLVLYLLSIE